MDQAQSGKSLQHSLLYDVLNWVECEFFAGTPALGWGWDMDLKTSQLESWRVKNLFKNEFEESL